MNENALNIIKENYTEFSKYTMHYRTYPSVYDGCKIAQRRVLWSAFSKAPASKMVKLSSMGGYTALVHPHSEATDVIVNMAGKYKTAFPLFDTKGNWGDNFGNAASAPRYLECKLNDKARKLYFSMIDEAPFENFEVEEEPLYLPTLFPLAFLQGCFSIGQGTPNPLIPDLQFEDLKNYIINFIKTGSKEVTKDNFVRFVDYDKIRNDKDKDDSICRVLNTGKGSVYYQPTIEFSKDKNTITISNLYILADFKSLIDRFKDDISADKIDIRDESTNERVWVIEKVKNKVFDMEDCARVIKQKFTYKENYAMYFHDENGCVRPYSLGEVIETCYNKYREAYKSKINKEIADMTINKFVLECLAKMSEHTDIVINNSINDIEKVKQLKSVINFEEKIIEKALQKPISWLKKDINAISKIEKDIEKKRKMLIHIDDTIIKDIKNI